MDEITFGEVIRSIRKAKGMTQEEVQRESVPPALCQRWKTEARFPPGRGSRRLWNAWGSLAILMPISSATARRRENSFAGSSGGPGGGRVERAEELLLRWKRRSDPEDAMERQFWQTAELLWRRIYEAPGPEYREKCMELFSLTVLPSACRRSGGRIILPGPRRCF